MTEDLSLAEDDGEPVEEAAGHLDRIYDGADAQAEQEVATLPWVIRATNERDRAIAQGPDRAPLFMARFLREAEAAAQTGEFSSTGTNKAYSGEVVAKQLDTLYHKLARLQHQSKQTDMTPEHFAVRMDKALEAVTRSGGLRAGIDAIMKSDVSGVFVEALRQRADERYPELAADSSAVEAEVPAGQNAESLAAQAELEQATADLNAFKESVASEQDKKAAWQYATALHEYEINSALKNLSPEGRQANLHTTMRTLFEKLQAAREKAGEK